MKELPILFSTPMVRAILDGRKTMTRRVLTPQPEWVFDHWRITGYEGRGENRHIAASYPFDPIEYAKPEAKGWFSGSGCPYGKVGDQLWVRESWYSTPNKKEFLGYIADDDIPHNQPYRIRPSIFMFRKFSRIDLEITNVRVEKLNSVSREDAIQEGLIHIPGQIEPDWWQNGISEGNYLSPVKCFADLWDSINGKKYTWESNPFVWVVSFKKL